MLFDILIIIGCLLVCFTMWLVSISRDPLGYFPSFTVVPGLVGTLLLIIGLIGKGVLA